MKQRVDLMVFGVGVACQQAAKQAGGLFGYGVAAALAKRVAAQYACGCQVAAC